MSENKEKKSTDDWAEELIDEEYDPAFAKEAARTYLNYVNAHPWEAHNTKDMKERNLIFAKKQQIKGAFQRHRYNKALAKWKEDRAKLAKYEHKKNLKGIQLHQYKKLKNRMEDTPEPQIWEYTPMNYEVDNLYNLRNRYDIQEIIGEKKSAKFFEVKSLMTSRKPMKRRGCDFAGILQIVEYEDDKYYVPDSYHCSLKVAKKVASLEGWTDNLHIPLENRDFMTSNFINKEIKKVFDWNKFPVYARWNSEKGAFTMTDHNHKSSSKYTILGIELKEGEYHDILAKDPEIAESLKSRGRQWIPQDYDQILNLIKLEKSTKLSEDQLLIRQPQGKKFIDDIWIYDIETYNAYYKKTALELIYSDEKEDNNAWMLVPIALAYKRVNINDDSKVIVKDEEVLVGEDCWSKFVDILAKAKDLPKTKVKGQKELVPTIYLYGHNAGKFDHLYSKSMKRLKFMDQIEGSTIKMLQAKIDNSPNMIIMHDSLLFTQASLESSAKFFNTPRKIKFDIKNMTREDYNLSEIIPQEELDNPKDSEDQRKWKIERRMKRGWKQYLKRDVECLAEIMKKLERYLRNFGCSASNHCGIPGVAWDVMNNDCIWMKEVHISIDAVTCNFLRQMVMGGRLLHWMKLINWKIEDVEKILKKDKFKPEEKDEYIENDVFVALDANSLYPSAMQIGQYPVGKFKILTNPKQEDVIKLLKEKKLFAAEVEFHPMNTRYPLIPYKTFEGNLIYPANHKFTYKGRECTFRGVYTSVEICQALCLGYKLGANVHNLIYWPKSERIFENLIDKLYDERNKLKKEGNPMEHLCKILLNSLYGKLLEIIKTGSIFLNDVTKPKKSVFFNDIIGEPDKLANGQTEVHFHLTRPKETKPVQLGAFVLAYARAIMNEIIIAVGPENIAYSDTDSIYVRKSALKLAEVKAKMHNNLGGFKNDYGETSIITKAMIVDIKRYLLELKYDPKEVEERKKDEEEKKAIWLKDQANLDKLREYEKACDKNDFPRLKAKFTGICFKQDGVLQNWDNKGSLTGYENLYAWFICNPGKLTDNKIVQEKWIRTEKDVHIVERKFKFSADPQSRGCWINPSELVDCKETLSGKKYVKGPENIHRLEFYPIGYDFTLPERKMKYEPANAGFKGASIIDELKKLHSPQYRIRGNKLSSRHMLKHPDKMGEEDKCVVRNKISNKKFETDLMTAVDKKEETSYVFLMEKDFKGNVNYFKTGKYGRTCKVDDEFVHGKLTNHAFLITLPQSAYPHGINLSEEETQKIHQEINRLISQAINKDGKDPDQRTDDEKEFIDQLASDELRS